MSDTNYTLPTYAERKEIVYFQLDTPLITPANGSEQRKNGYRFTINDRSSLYDWSEGYFDVTLHLEYKTIAGGGSSYVAASNASIICGIHSLIRRLTLGAQGGATIYNQDEINKAIFLKKLLEIDPNHATKQNEYWYLDKSTALNDTNIDPESGTAFRGNNLRKKLWMSANVANVPPTHNFRIPLKWYSYFQSLKWQNLLFTGMQLTLQLDIETDNNLIMRDGAAAVGRVVIDKFELALPQIQLRPQYYEEYLKFVSSGSPVRWSYQKERIESSTPTTSQTGLFKIPAVYSPRKVFVFFLTAIKQNSQTANMYAYDDILSTVGTDQTVNRLRLEFSDGTYYPRTDYLSDQVARIYGDVLEYAHHNDDMAAGSQYTRDQFSINSMYYFDLAYAKDNIVTDSRDMTVNFSLSANTAENYQVYAVIFEEHSASYGMENGSFQITDEVTMKA